MMISIGLGLGNCGSTILWLSGFSEMKSVADAHAESNVVTIGEAMMCGRAGFFWEKAEIQSKK
jgi:hypothetical protein